VARCRHGFLMRTCTFRCADILTFVIPVSADALPFSMPSIGEREREWWL
jgi:hypothetical protein